MTPANKKRIEQLEKALTSKKKRPRCARVCYDPSIPNFDPDISEIEADIMFVLPNNGRRCSDGKSVPHGSYKVTYS